MGAQHAFTKMALRFEPVTARAFLRKRRPARSQTTLVAVALMCLGAAPVADFTMPRSTCLPPCAIFFDATTTTDSDIPDSSDRFKFLHYEWDFGDPDSGFWGEGARAGTGDPHPRNVDTSPLAGHVYEAAGTYTVTLSVFDGTSTSMTTRTVTIQDPNGVEWSGTETICISADLGHPGCPMGATTVVTSDFDAALIIECDLDIKTSSVRCLFERGDTFTMDATLTLRTDGPSMIGAYGTGAKPRVDVPFDPLPKEIILLKGVNDLRVVDINFIGSDLGGAKQNILGTRDTTLHPITRFLVLRVDVSDAGAVVQTRGNCLRAKSLDPSVSGRMHEEIAVIDSTGLSQPSPGANTLFSSARFDLTMGNRFGDHERGPTGNQHIIRVHFWDRAVLSHNSLGLFTFDDPNNIDGCSRSVLTVRAGCAGNLWFEDPNSDETIGWTSQFILADNWFSACIGGSGVGGTAGSWPVTILRQNNQADGLREHMHTYIVERNLFTSNAHEKSSMAALFVSGEDGVVRNNVFDLSRGSVSTASLVGVVVRDRRLNSVDPLVIGPDRIEVLHNTFFVDGLTELTSTSKSYAIATEEYVTNITIQNNLLYDEPNGVDLRFIDDQATPTPSTLCASCNVEVASNPFASVPSLPMTFAEAHLDPNSTIVLDQVVDRGIADSLSSTVVQDQDMHYRYTPTGAVAQGTNPDPGSDELNAATCSVPADCDDGIVCNGSEDCVAGNCVSGVPVDCDDGVGCTIDGCNESTGSCDNIAGNSLCDNGLYCDGVETCHPTLDCQPGTAVSCDDGVSCTDDSCNEGSDSCDNLSNCDNGVFCDGAESCDPVLGCQVGTDPCPGQLCDEAGDVCVDCFGDPDCQDGLYCNGAETCVAGSCVSGVPVTCDDGVSCTDDSCNEGSDSCDNLSNCDNGVFCDGAESCDPVLGCQVGTDPCPGQLCDEAGDVCVDCFGDPDCQDGLFCNGAETCVGGACQSGSDPCPGQGCDEGTDSCPGGPTGLLESSSVTVGGTAVTVSLTTTYVSAVVVCSVQVNTNTTPVVARVSNVSASSFDVRLQNPSGGAITPENVSCLVVEEGVWTVEGVKLEAQAYLSTVTDRKRSWVAEPQTYGQSYTNPVVLGQVMSENDPEWSVFWSRGSSRTNPPSAASLWTGKEVAEDLLVARADETIGFIVFEAGHGTIGGVAFEAALGPDSVSGVDNGPPFSYAFSTPFGSSPEIAVVTMAAMDGGNGGWAQVHGATLANATTLFLSVDEDQIGDSERVHTTEQVGYVVFESPVVFP